MNDREALLRDEINTHLRLHVAVGRAPPARADDYLHVLAQYGIEIAAPGETRSNNHDSRARFRNRRSRPDFMTRQKWRRALCWTVITSADARQRQEDAEYRWRRFGQRPRVGQVVPQDIRLATPPPGGRATTELTALAG